MNTTFKVNVQFFGKDYEVAKRLGLFDDGLEGRLTTIFMDHYNDAVDIFNSKIGDINEAWDKTGKEASFGDYAEDVNPEYVDFIRERIKDDLDELNNRLEHEEHFPMDYMVDDEGCMGANLRQFNDLYMKLYLVPA